MSENKTYTYQGYDRPEVGNRAWMNLGMLEETAVNESRRAMLTSIREYLTHLEEQARKVR